MLLLTLPLFALCAAKQRTTKPKSKPKSKRTPTPTPTPTPNPTPTPFDRAHFQHPPFPAATTKRLQALSDQIEETEEKLEAVLAELQNPVLDGDRKIDLEFDSSTMHAQLEKLRAEYNAVLRAALHPTPRPTYLTREGYYHLRKKLLEEEQVLVRKRTKLIDERPSFINNDDKEFWRAQDEIREEIRVVRAELERVHKEEMEWQKEQIENVPESYEHVFIGGSAKRQQPDEI
jgi:hypothetical protein